MPTLKSKAPFLVAIYALLLLPLALAGCGSNDGSITHIQGSSTTITKPMLDHWMRAAAGNDFRISIGTKGPRGFVSEPANYAECAEAAKKVVPRSFTGKLKLTDAEISTKCHELYQAVKAQAMSYILSAQWAELDAKELGIPLSEAELHKEFLRYRKEAYNSPSRYLSYIKERQLGLSDILFQLRHNVLADRILAKLKAKADGAGGGPKAYAKLVRDSHYDHIAKTTCKAGYVTENCSGYRAPATALSSPNAILEAFVQAVRKA